MWLRSEAVELFEERFKENKLEYCKEKLSQIKSVIAQGEGGLSTTDKRTLYNIKQIYPEDGQFAQACKAYSDVKEKPIAAVEVKKGDYERKRQKEINLKIDWLMKLAQDA